MSTVPAEPSPAVPAQSTAASRRASPLALALTLLLCVGLGAALATMWKGDDEGPAGPSPTDPKTSASAPPVRSVLPDPTNPSRLVWESEDAFRADPTGPTLDFGDVEQGVRITKELRFRNAGRGPLLIDRVSSGCGCFSAEKVPNKTWWEPGESGRILIHMDSSNKHGAMRKQMVAYTNQPGDSDVRFMCTANVAKGLVVTESVAKFGLVPRGTATTARITLGAPVADGPFEILEVKGTRPAADGRIVPYTFRAEPIESRTEGIAKQRVVITHPGLDRAGTHSDALTIRTTHPKRPELTVPAYLQVSDRIQATLDVVSLGLVGPNRPERPPVLVRLKPGIPGLAFRITGTRVEAHPGEKMTADGPGFVVRFDHDPEGAFVEIAYDKKDRRPQLLKATLVILTDDAEQPEVRIPLRAEVR